MLIRRWIKTDSTVDIVLLLNKELGRETAGRAEKDPSYHTAVLFSCCPHTHICSETVPLDTHIHFHPDAFNISVISTVSIQTRRYTIRERSYENTQRASRGCFETWAVSHRRPVSLPASDCSWASSTPHTVNHSLLALSLQCFPPQVILNNRLSTSTQGLSNLGLAIH